MARREIPTAETLWNRHVSLYQEVFILALQELSVCSLDRECDEDAISERLCPILRAVCFREAQRMNSEIPIPLPQWEQPIQPITEFDLKGGRHNKRPDFTCSVINRMAGNEYEYEIGLHIECKLLGLPRSASWILNSNYVRNGVERFDSPIHEYGKRASSGIMIGYIMTMCPRSILAEVNAYVRKYCPHNHLIEFECARGNVTQYRQPIARRFLQPPGFRLVHLWVDLRVTPSSDSRVGEPV